MSAADQDRLSEELRALASRVDPPPGVLVEAARAAFSWRTLDAELAELVYDSVADERLALALRSSPTELRLLTFTVDDVTVEVEVAVQGTLRRLVGQVVPMQPARIEICHGSGVATAQADEIGRFRADALPAGPVSLRCHLGEGDDARVVKTDWLLM
ncbi:MAG TPA: hypothetical protein VM324_12685 [Egibacteraceae bacterium]|nr:hypothetical protein [Egibacteraceae bacterium]